MVPSVIYETLAADSTLAGLIGTFKGGPAIIELQSVDERPVHDAHFIIIDFQESTIAFKNVFGPQVMQVWVHVPLDIDRDYSQITKILNQVNRLILPLEQAVGSDGVRVTQVEAHGRSRNTIDPGWATATRNALYGVLYDESSL